MSRDVWVRLECRYCRAESGDVASLELWERWMKAHIATYHPESLDDFSQDLIDGRYRTSIQFGEVYEDEPGHVHSICARCGVEHCGSEASVVWLRQHWIDQHQYWL